MYTDDSANLEVRVGNNTIDTYNPPALNGNIMCRFINNPQGNLSATLTAMCLTPVVGRYVSVQRIGTASGNLVLCEVQVFAPSLVAAAPAAAVNPPPPSGLVEMAYGKPAFSSSVWSTRGPSLAVDGVIGNCDDSVYNTFNSNQEDAPWW